MATSHGSKARIYANGYDLTTYFRSLSTPTTVDVAEASTFGVDSKKYVPGLRDATLSADGLFDGAEDAADQVLNAALGQAHSIWTYLPAGDGLGNLGTGFDGIETTYEIESPVDDVVATTAEAQSSTGRELLRVLHVLQAETASGNGTGVDNAAATTRGGAAFLQATTPGATGVTVRVQHSVDNTTWVDLVAFTAVASPGRNAQRIAVVGTVNRYLRAAWTNVGAGASPSFHVGFARR